MKFMGTSHLGKVSKILICEDHPFVQKGLEAVLLEIFKGATLIRAETGLKAVELAKSSLPDLVFVDLGLPDISGIEVIKKIRTFLPLAKIVVLTNCEFSSVLNEVRSLSVSAIIQKVSHQDTFEQILEAVLAAPLDASPFLDLRTRQILGSKTEIDFTPRETQVLKEIVAGKSNQQIADALGCALTTVRFHRANILDKAGVRNAAELTAWYLTGQTQSRGSALLELRS